MTTAFVRAPFSLSKQSEKDLKQNLIAPFEETKVSSFSPRSNNNSNNNNYVVYANIFPTTPLVSPFSPRLYDNLMNKWWTSAIPSDLDFFLVDNSADFLAAILIRGYVVVVDYEKDPSIGVVIGFTPQNKESFIGKLVPRLLPNIATHFNYANKDGTAKFKGISSEVRSYLTSDNVFLAPLVGKHHGVGRIMMYMSYSTSRDLQGALHEIYASFYEEAYIKFALSKEPSASCTDRNQKVAYCRSLLLTGRVVGELPPRAGYVKLDKSSAFRIAHANTTQDFLSSIPSGAVIRTQDIDFSDLFYLRVKYFVMATTCEEEDAINSMLQPLMLPGSVQSDAKDKQEAAAKTNTTSPIGEPLDKLAFSGRLHDLIEEIPKVDGQYYAMCCLMRKSPNFYFESKSKRKGAEKHSQPCVYLRF